MRNQLWYELQTLKEAMLLTRQLHRNAAKKVTGDKRERHLRNAAEVSHSLHEVQDWLAALAATQQQAIDLSEAGNLRTDEPDPEPAQDWSDALLEQVYQRR